MTTPVRLYLASVLTVYETDEGEEWGFKLLDGPHPSEQTAHWTGWREANKQAAKRRIERDLTMRKLRDEIDTLPGMVYVFPETAVESMSLHHLIQAGV